MPIDRMDDTAPGWPEVSLLGVGPRPVRGIYGIGRNYAGHARELGNVIPEEPVVFAKPIGCLIGDGGRIILPARSRDVQHEVEMVVLLGRGGRAADREHADEWIAGYGVGLDVTARDLQNQARAEGHPWTVAKGFDTFAPVSAFVPANRITDPRDLAFELRVNGQLRQTGNSRDMLFDVAALIAYLSGIVTLYPGDLIYTGTPEGVARIEPGDVLSARLVDYGASVTVTAVAAST